MAGASPAPLTPPATPEEAKRRLREVAEQVGVSGWVRRHPYGALGTALICGMALGRSECGVLTASEIVPLLVRLLR